MIDQKKHDLKKAVRLLGNIITLARQGFDFSGDEGIEILNEAEEYRQLLIQELNLGK